MTKRKEFSRATKQATRERTGDRCERCGSADGPFDFNHRVPAWLDGDNSPENCEQVCRYSCHRQQTSKDQAAFAKVNRIAGKTRSQWTGTHRGKGALSGKRRTGQACKQGQPPRAFQTSRELGGPSLSCKRRIQSRPFRKDVRKKLSGEVVRR